jgi:tyrosine-protein kinase
VELRDYWTTVRRRWRVVVAVLAVTVGAAAFITWQATPMYSSSARLFVATSESDATQAYQGNLFATQRVESYADIVPKSRKLAEQVVDDLGDGSDPDVVRSQVKATVVPDTVNLEITATDADPVRARDIAQAYAEALSDLVATLETPEGKSNALIKAEIVDDAHVSTSPVSPQPVRNLGLGLVLGLLLGVGLAVVRELLDTSISSTEDVAQVTPAPVLGRITSDPTAVREPVDTSLAGTSSWSEAFRVLRTNLQYIEVDNDQKVFVITSAVPEEGKSTTAVHLAVTLALTHQKVALVECDLRRPLIAKRLDIDGAVGTTSVLIGQVSLREAMQSYGDTGLKVLACGPIPPNPSELLQSKAMETMLAQLRAEYDIVLLDAPPLLPVTDAALLSAQADGALLVLRHGKTSKDQLSHAVERLDAVDAKTLGIVLNMVPVRHRAGDAYSYTYQYAYAARREPDTGSGGRQRGRSGHDAGVR